MPDLDLIDARKLRTTLLAFVLMSICGWLWATNATANDAIVRIATERAQREHGGEMNKLKLETISATVNENKTEIAAIKEQLNEALVLLRAQAAKVK